LISVPLIALACICIAIGRYQIRRARRVGGVPWIRRALSWGVVLAGFLLMILGVMFWGIAAR
jgi:hypothetical protein